MQKDTLKEIRDVFKKIYHSKKLFANISPLDKILIKSCLLPDKLDMVEQALKAGANTNVVITYLEKQTPLHLMVLKGDLDSVKLLLKYNADITIQNKNGETPEKLAFNCYKKEGLKEYLDICFHLKMTSQIKQKKAKIPLINTEPNDDLFGHSQLLDNDPFDASQLLETLNQDPIPFPLPLTL